MDAILEAIQHLWGRPWFHEVLIFLFFACVFLGYKISETEKYLRWRVKSNPKDFGAHLKLGEFLSEFEDSYEEAELEFKKALEIEPNNRDAMGELFLVQKNAGKIEDSEKTISELLQLFPNDSTVNVWAGRHYADKNSAKAEEFFVKAKSINPSSEFINDHYGYFLFNQSRYLEAIDVFKDTLKNNFYSVYSYKMIIDAFINMKEINNALEYSQKFISVFPNNIESNHYLALSLYFLDRFDESEKIYKKVFSKKPDYAKFYIDFGFLLYFGTKNYAQAETVFRRALDIDIKNIHAYRILANLLRTLGRSRESEELLHKAIELKQTDSALFSDLGDLLYSVSRYEEAKKCYEQAIELDKTEFHYYYDLGVTLAERLNQLEEGEYYINKSIDLNQEFAPAYVTLGNIYNKRKQFVEAEKAYRKSLSIDPRNDYAQHCYSKLLINLSRVEEAINILLEMKNNFPNEHFVHIELASAYKAIGKQKELLEALETSRLLIKQDSKTYWYDLACVESIAGNTDLAFDYLRKSKEENQLNSEWAWEDSDLDWIRDDARFIEIVGEKPQEKLTN